MKKIIYVISIASFSLLFSQEEELDLDAMWDNTIWNEIEEVTTKEYEVEKVTTVAGVRGAEAEDEALHHLYYRQSMKGPSEIQLNKALGKLLNTLTVLKEKNPENGILHSHGDKVFYQEFNWENNIPSLQSKPKIYQLGDITTKKNIAFQSNCGPILSPEIIIEESKPSSLNIGLLANHKYDELINFRPYQIVPNYVAKFETKPIA